LPSDIISITEHPTEQVIYDTIATPLSPSQESLDLRLEQLAAGTGQGRNTERIRELEAEVRVTTV
jgi:hypothetical protein